eukprot:5939068-Alexandrium_andersonii.AAC.1
MISATVAGERGRARAPVASSLGYNTPGAAAGAASRLKEGAARSHTLWRAIAAVRRRWRRLARIPLPSAFARRSGWAPAALAKWVGARRVEPHSGL